MIQKPRVPTEESPEVEPEFCPVPSTPSEDEEQEAPVPVRIPLTAPPPYIRFVPRRRVQPN